MTWVFLVNYQQHPGSERAYGAWSRGRSADKAARRRRDVGTYAALIMFLRYMLTVTTTRHGKDTPGYKAPHE